MATRSRSGMSNWVSIPDQRTEWWGWLIQIARAHCRVNGDGRGTTRRRRFGEVGLDVVSPRRRM